VCNRAIGRHVGIWGAVSVVSHRLSSVGSSGPFANSSTKCSIGNRECYLIGFSEAWGSRTWGSPVRCARNVVFPYPGDSNLAGW